jgi:dipeptidyl aminopeptidase/acylaminoacyl peptidase
VAFVLRSTDLEADKGRTDLWLVGADGSGLRRLTASPESESSPAWAPDGGAVYFLSARGGPRQVWRLRLDGGEAEKVTSLPADVGSFALSRDGRRLVFSVEVFPDCAGTPEGAIACTARRVEERARAKASGRLFTRLPVRHWDEWRDGRRHHLFSLPLAGGLAAAGAAPADLMREMDADCPSRPFGGAADYDVAPDGAAVVFSAKDAGREEAWSTDFDLFSVPADGAAPPRRLTAGNPAADAGPSFSPDGRWLAWRAMAVPGYEADRWRIRIRAWPDGPEREVAPALDVSPSGLVWSGDGRTLFAPADHRGTHPLFAVDVATGKARVAVEGSVAAPAWSGGKGGGLVYVASDLSSPGDVWTARADGSGARAITRVNAAALEGVAMGPAERFAFAGWGGERVEGWIVMPPRADPSRKVPVALLIHGGPQGSWNGIFHYRWNPQVFAGAGYAAVMVDFHGSTGYGQAFTDSIRDDWGGKPLEDLRKGLAAAIESRPALDGARVAALGGSYGGWMVDWIAGAWPDRFRCLVSHDGNLDVRSAYFDTEELWFPEREHGGTPWEVPEAYERHNPVNLVREWRTPILLVHGGRDFRVVETQGLAAFTAAQRRGVPSELLHFPDENHWVLKPANSLLWHETVLGWLDRWTR